MNEAGYGEICPARPADEKQSFCAIALLRGTRPRPPDYRLGPTTTTSRDILTAACRTPPCPRAGLSPSTSLILGTFQTIFF